MIVCLDTNVFVSGILWRGLPGRVLEQWIDGQFEVVASPEILLEYEEVLHRFEKKMPWEDLLNWVDFSKSRTRLVTPRAWPNIVCRDADDQKFLTCSLEGHADYLISGDKDLLSIKQEFPFQIIRPAAFLKTIKTV